MHIDQSYTASIGRVAHHLPDEAEALLQKRFQIINVLPPTETPPLAGIENDTNSDKVWRPIKTILKDPLAVADAHSVPESDLVGVGLIYPDRRGETFTVRPNEGHRWYFKYAQRPDEVTLIKCFDTVDEPGVARRVPHTAFVDESEEDKESRESIEVRALVFY